MGRCEEICCGPGSKPAVPFGGELGTGSPPARRYIRSPTDGDHFRASFSTAAALALCALTACSTSPPVPPVQTVCLPMATYSQAAQTALAKEWRALDPNSLTASRFIPDSIALRDSNRAACGAKP